MHDSSPRVRALSGRIQEILSPPRSGAGELPELPELPVRTGWETLDAALGGGLARGVVHEWFGTYGSRAGRGRGGCAGVWTPPLYLAVQIGRAHV